MIEISLTTALALYSGALLLGALAIWVYTESASHHAWRTIERQHLWRCIYCTFVYLDEGAGKLSHCPRCGSINTLGDTGARYVRPTREQRQELDQREEKPDGSHRGSKQKRPGQRSRGGRRRR